MPVNYIVNRLGGGLKPTGGSTQKIVVPHNAIFNVAPNQAFSISAIVLPKQILRRNNISSKRGVVVGTLLGGYLFAIEAGGQLIFALDENTGTSTGRRDLIYSPTALVRPDEIAHLVITKSTSFGSLSAYKYYYQGELVAGLTFSTGSTGAIASGTNTSNSSDLTILYENQVAQGTAQSAELVKHDLKFFNKELTADEVKALRDGDGASIPNTALSSLVEWWSFNQKQGTTLPGAKGNNGTLTGFTTSLGVSNQWVNENQEPFLTA
jgi:hypothetical protein